MPVLSALSLSRLETCDDRLQRVLKEAIKYFDFTVLEGHRDQAAQDKAFAEGRSKLKWPNGNHNSLPSKAVDIAPFPIDFNDRERFFYLAAFVIGIATQMQIKLRWGGDWQRDHNFRANKFSDLPHLEIDE